MEAVKQGSAAVGLKVAPAASASACRLLCHALLYPTLEALCIRQLATCNLRAPTS